MKKIFIYLFPIFICNTACYSQKQNYNWLFGYNSAITWKTKQIKKLQGVYGTTSDFLTDLPTNFTGNPMTTYEGCFSISDANGDLLFFLMVQMFGIKICKIYWLVGH